MVLNLRTELETVQQAYLDNADYEEVASVTKAKVFVSACRKLLLLLPQMTRQASRFELQIDTKVIPEALKHAKDWISSVSGSAAGAVRAFSLTDFGE